MDSWQVILHLAEQNGFLDDIKSLLSLRLVSRSWNLALRHVVGSRTVTVLSEKNMSSFSQFLSSETSDEVQESNIRSTIFNINIRPDTNYMKILNEFGHLPSLFRSQLRAFKLNFDYSSTSNFEPVWNFFQKAELHLLEELEVTGRRYVSLFNVPTLVQGPQASDLLERIRFPSLRRLSVPLHVSREFLMTCSPLSHLSLQVYDVNLGSDFWDSFKTIVCSRGHNESLKELFFVEKRCNSKFKDRFSPRHLFESNLRLKKLGFRLLGSHLLENHMIELVQFLSQQSNTLEYLQLPKMNIRSQSRSRLIFDSDVLTFPKLIELNFDDFFYWNWTIGKMVSNFPMLEKISLPTPGFGLARTRPLNCNKWLEIKSVEIRGCDFFPCSVGIYVSIFPNMHKLKLQGPIRRVSTLVDILAHGKDLKDLSIKVKIINERALKRYDESYHAKYGYSSEEEFRARKRAGSMKTDCYLLGHTPRYCTPYYSGQLVLDKKTQFRIPTAPSISNFHQLEYLKLEGYFTELTLWAGIKNLTELKELHLKTQHSIHPKTFLNLESHLVNLKKWSYTKLKDKEFLRLYNKMYKYFRILSGIMNLERLHVWKFSDHHVEKKLITLSEFDSLDLN